MADEQSSVEIAADAPDYGVDVTPAYACDRCGATMVEINCKVVCLNCGHRFDCSDLNIYSD